MLSIIICVLAFSAALFVGRRSFAWGLGTAIGIGYLYGITRANILQPASHVIFDVAVIDALNAGLPVVVTALGGVQEIVDSTCGLVVPPGDADALARALDTFVSSRTTRAQFGGRARARADALCNPARQLMRLHQMLAHSLSAEAIGHAAAQML